MKSILLLVVLITILVIIYIRVAPSDAERWHVDPAIARNPGQAGHLLDPGPRFDVSPAMLLRKIDDIALDWPRTKRLAGSIEEGRLTYVTRTKWIGFPDYTTVAFVETDGSVAPVILARLRFGGGDLGVNRKRVEAWVEELSNAYSPLDQ